MAFGKALRVLLVSAFAATTVLAGSVVRAQEARAVGVTPPRLSFMDGEVSYWRPGAEDWAPAQINTALAAGDSLYAGETGNVEIEVGNRAYIRAGSGTELGIESLETGYLQVRVPSGHAAVDLKRLPEGQEIEVDTPNGAFLIERTGYYRVDVDENSTRFAARRGGVARIVPAGGQETQLASGEDIEVTGTETASLQTVAAAADDAWDRWNYNRTGQIAERPRSEQYVAGAVAGVDDLDRYGDWRETPKYGHVWVPRDVGSDWVPYSDGRWVWDGSYGWTWVDYAPWGWAPYHYGRWCWADGYWGWAPGPVVAHPAYSPALVAFFGGGGVGVSVSVGTPFVSWVALGYGEPVVPWWGPSGFVGRPYWGGWGGPRYVNHVHVENTTIINVNNINGYDNFRNGRAVVGIEGDRFGRGGRVQNIRVDENRLRNLRPIRGDIGVRPARESLVAREGRGQRPPDRIQNRQVVATRKPQDPSRLPRAAGLVRSNDRRPEPRIVGTRERGQEGRELTRGRNEPPVRLDRDTIRERGQGRIDDLRGGDRNDAASRGGEPTNRLDRTQGSRGDEAAIRRGPQPPGENDRIQRGRDARGIERSERGVDGKGGAPSQPDRGGERAAREPTPPSVERMQQRERNDRARNPEPPAARGGNDARGRDRAERTREVAPPRSTDQGTLDRGPLHRMEQPRERAPEPPRMQRQQTPRTERQQQQRVERKAAPRVERQESPRVEQKQQPRVERQQAPRVERDAGGNQRGGGGEPRGHGHKRDS